MGRISVGRFVIASSDSEDVRIDDIPFRLSGITEHDVLTYDGAVVRGVRPVTALNDLEDVNTAGAENGHCLTYVNGVWVPAPPSGGGGGNGGTVLGYRWEPLAPPPTPSGLDDEFRYSQLPGWYEFDPNNLLTVTVEYPPGWAVFTQQPRSGDNIVGIFKERPQSDSFTAWTLVALQVPAANYSAAGIALMYELTVSSPIYCFAVEYTNRFRFTVFRFNDHNTWGATIASIESWDAFGFLRVRVAGNTVRFDAGKDGIGWINVWTGTILPVPQYVGLYTNSVDLGVPISARFKFFRYVSVDVGLHAPCAGAPVPIYG